MAKTYPKNSFDRFGDDLTELIINYLPFEDKLKFECVCKQWRRLIFNKELRFELLRHRFKSGQKQLFLRSFVHQNQTYELDATILLSLMKKLRSLTEMAIDYNVKCDENVLRVFCQMADKSLKNLKSIEFRLKDDIDTQVLNEFSKTFGRRLTNISVSGLSEQSLAGMLSLFGHNLKTIDLKQNLRSVLMNQREMTDKTSINNYIAFNKLEKVFLTNPSTQDFEEFVLKYGHHLKQLSLSFDQHYKHNINQTLKYVSNLDNLQVFRLDSELFYLKQNDISINEQHIIDESLQLIGRKCLRLRSVDICIFGDLISDAFLKIFGKYFHCLERLDLSLWDIGNKFFQTVNCFGFQSQNGKHLTKLNLMFEQLCDDHLKDIHLFLPNLMAIKLNSDEHLTDQCLRHLSKLNHLRTVVLEGNILLDYLTIDGIIEFITCCPSIQILDIEFENDFNEVGYDVFKVIAVMRPQINFFISFHDHEDRYKDVCVYANLKNNLHVYKI